LLQLIFTATVDANEMIIWKLKMHLLKTIQNEQQKLLKLQLLMQQILLNWCEIEKEYIDIADDAKEHAEHIVIMEKYSHQENILLFWAETWMIWW
jgi:hypothetical protein